MTGEKGPPVQKTLTGAAECLRLVACSEEIDHLGAAHRAVRDDEAGAPGSGCARSKSYADRATRVRS